MKPAALEEEWWGVLTGDTKNQLKASAKSFVDNNLSQFQIALVKLATTGTARIGSEAMQFLLHAR